MVDTDAGFAPASAPRAMEIEPHGIAIIPDEDRSASVFDFMRIAWGGANSLATAVLGAFPIIFGLSFWQSVAAAVLGVVVGGLILAPMAIFGAMNGTNNAVSSSAHFGVVGRIVGSFLALLTAICFFAISVWSSGDALVGTAHRLFGMPESELFFGIAYGLFALAILTVCIYGFQLMLVVNKVAVTLVSALMLVGFVAFAPQFDSGFAGAGLAVGGPGFWPAFIGSTLIVLSNPISFGAFLGDWTRYVPRQTPKCKLMGAAFLAQVLTLLPFIFGVATASIVATHAPDYIAAANYTGGLITVSPAWYLPLLLGLALVSGMSTGTTSLYGTGLDFSSVFPRLSRVRATVLIGVVSIVLIFVGRFSFSLIASITTLVTLIIVTTTPWMAVMIVGAILRRGHYLPEHMQVFNQRKRGGAYWFNNGWNLPGMLAWIPSAVIALMLVNIPGQFVGWLGDLFGGIDLSLVVALVLPAIIYPVLLFVFPEPREVYGPRGALLVPMSDRPIPPIMNE